MESTFFYKLGRGIYRFRVAMIVVWMLVIAACIPFLPHIMSPFKSTGFVADDASSTAAQKFLDKKLGFNQDSRFLVLYHSPNQPLTSKVAKKAIHQSLIGLKDFPIKHEIIYPEDNPQQISKNKHSAYAVILVNSTKTLSSELLEQFQRSIKTPKGMNMDIGGNRIFTEGINKETQKDLYRADAIAAPVTGIVLIVVLGTVIAMLLPICLGGGCALIIFTTLFFLGHLFTLSIFTINLALLLGLCLSLDYALFIIFRFRGELHRHNMQTALCITLATAGRAVFYSGVAVFISLSALLLFPINILFSIGIGGLVAVFMAVMLATTLLPAILAVLKHRINFFPIRSIDKTDSTRRHLWRSLAQRVIKHPLRYFISSLVFLLVLGYSLLNVHFGISDFRIVPKHTESREFFDAYKKDFNERDLTPIVLIVSTKKGSILSAKNIGKVYDFASKLEKNKHIERVESIVSSSPRLPKRQYQVMYQSSAQRQHPPIKQLLKTTTGTQFTILRVYSKYRMNTKQNKALIRELRKESPGKGLELQVTGLPVQNLDVMDTIKDIFPYAAAWVITLTYFSLLILLRSVFLPLKAIFMNILSLSACYGMLVFIFQEGHLHEWLNFDPQGMLDITMVVIIFCAIFGFSMDYEVFLLTRIQEYYKKTHDNNASIVFGIDKSNRIITSAALIVICICGSFMTANVLMVKAFGLGIAVAIAVDAFAIRSILVPSTMALMKSWNWYFPKWLDKLLP